MEFTIEQLSDFAFQVANRTAEAYGHLSKTITRAQVVDTYGRTMFEQSKYFVKWQQKGGKTSPWICKREDFEKFLLQKNAKLKPIK